uniref:Uncharacterized protein n=1 Tax=Romanomermis culicivorax TaxID=13658 RepID=A0A915IES6_ROMCU
MDGDATEPAGPTATRKIKEALDGPHCRRHAKSGHSPGRHKPKTGPSGDMHADKQTLSFSGTNARKKKKIELLVQQMQLLVV